MRKRQLAKLLSAAFVLGTAAQGQAVVGQTTAVQAAVTGSVVYRQRIALPPDAIVHVKLQDVALADSPAKTLAEVDIPTAGRQVPISFRVAYTPADVDPSHRYAVRATITSGGKLLWTSTQSYAVITQGNPTEVQVLVEQAAASPAARPESPSSFPAFTHPATYEGEFVCADCSGIRLTLTLRPDNTYLSRRVYVGAAEGRDAPFHEIGRWSLEREGTRLVLRGGKEAPQLWQVENPDTLRQLDTEGKPIESAFNQLLKRREKVDPIYDVFRIRGEFVYMADTAAFTECESQKRFTVAQEGDYLSLERAYTKQRSQPGANLLVTFDGHLALRPKLEGEGNEEVIVVDKFDKTWPGEQCSNPLSRSSTPLQGTRWELIELNGTRVLVNDSPGAYLELRSGQVTGSGGCNRLNGKYELADGLSFGAMASTMMACPDPSGSRERSFLNALHDTNRYQISGNILELRKGDKVLARLRAEKTDE
jgi:uncharacterized lipoprotein YbaY/heat shock protein HslJ/uncharacterized lipoprotein NlpE involved in copper resistance